jgi:hypothetical protein
MYLEHQPRRGIELFAQRLFSSLRVTTSCSGYMRVVAPVLQCPSIRRQLSDTSGRSFHEYTQTLASLACSVEVTTRTTLRKMCVVLQQAKTCMLLQKLLHH